MNPKYTQRRLSGLIKLKGKTFEEVFGPGVAKRMKEKMRLAKLGKKMPWNSKTGITGEKSPRWIKDRSKVKLDKERGGPLHKQWSRSVKNRDNWKCQMADENCLGRVISHHILCWSSHSELRYEIKNGITLCHFHHPRKRIDEERLAPEFRKLVESK